MVTDGLVGAHTQIWENRRSGFEPSYRQIYICLYDHLKWGSSVIGSCSQAKVVNQATSVPGDLELYLCSQDGSSSALSPVD